MSKSNGPEKVPRNFLTENHDRQGTGFREAAGTKNSENKSQQISALRAVTAIRLPDLIAGAMKT